MTKFYKPNIQVFEYGPYREAIQCPCGTRWYWCRGDGHWLAANLYYPNVCPDCGRHETLFKKGSARAVREVTYTRILNRKRLRLIRHEWTEHSHG